MFAGTGNLGIESLSRGAVHAVFVDKSRKSISVIKANLEHTKFLDKAEIYNADAYDAIQKLADRGIVFDIIFLDPPYKMNIIPKTLELISQKGILSDKGIIIAEHHITDELPDNIRDFTLYDRRKYGETLMSMYRQKNV